MVEKRPYTVSQITALIKEILETRFPEIWVQGEISNFKLPSSGHLYFSLKDGHSQISSAMFRQNTKGLTTFPKSGDHVIVRGEVNVYPPRGSYQIIVRELFFVGKGELLLKLEALKKALSERGWFSPETKQPLPSSPKRIGVITSPTGAVIQDILNVLKRRHAGFSLLLNPVRVQGKGAAEEIAKAIGQLNEYKLVDVMIVGRGGGSLEDLWPFNEEVVAEAIFKSKIPIISAVGHETDVTIADLVADLRAPTPSAAAEIVAKSQMEHIATLAHYEKRFGQTLTHLLDRPKNRLRAICQHPFIRSPFKLIEPYQQRLDELKSLKIEATRRLLKEKKRGIEGAKKQLSTLQPLAKVRQMQTHFDALSAQATFAIGQITAKRKEKLLWLVRHLKSVDPKNLLNKGYSILIAQKDQRVVTSKDRVARGDLVKALVSDGEISLVVDDDK